MLAVDPDLATVIRAMDGQLTTRRWLIRQTPAILRTRVVRGRRTAERLRDNLLGLVYPSACAHCGTTIVDNRADSRRQPICRPCVGRLELLDGATCRRCSAIIPALANPDECPHCRHAKLRFDEAVAAGQYTGCFRQWILKMKNGPRDRLALVMAELVWERCCARLRAMRPDVVVPVAMHWRRRWMRRSNSAALLAERLAERLGVPCAESLLRRRRNTPPQFTLPPSERAANVRGAFAVRAGYHFEGARVLVVDDILTTGATCSEVARVLRRVGAGYVGVVVAARAIRL